MPCVFRSLSSQEQNIVDGESGVLRRTMQFFAIEEEN